MNADAIRIFETEILLSGSKEIKGYFRNWNNTKRNEFFDGMAVV